MMSENVIERNNHNGHVNKLVFVLKTDRKPSTEQSPGEHKMDTKMSNDSAKKIQRSVGTSDLHSHQSRKQSEDEGYGSRPASMALSPYTSKSSLHSTTSTANIPSTILEDDKDSEAISRHVCDHKDNYSSPLEEPNHEGEPSSPSEEPEHLSSKMASLNLTEQSVHQSFQKCSLCDSQLKARKLSYQHPPLHQRVHYRRGSEATVSTKPSQSEKEPTCIMCRRNSQKTSLPPKRKISKSYIFKATPMRRWNSDIITALYDEDDPENPFRKVRVTISKGRRMPKTISAKKRLKATCVEKELEESELLDIAKRLEPDILLDLAIKLSFSVAEYLRMKESHTSGELAFMILYKWRENRVKGQQNRKELVGVLFDLKKARLAEMVAKKS